MEYIYISGEFRIVFIPSNKVSDIEFMNEPVGSMLWVMLIDGINTGVTFSFGDIMCYKLIKRIDNDILYDILIDY